MVKNTFRLSELHLTFFSYLASLLMTKRYRYTFAKIKQAALISTFYRNLGEALSKLTLCLNVERRIYAWFFLLWFFYVHFCQWYFC